MTHPTAGLLEQLVSCKRSVAVIGLGYVGLPLAACLSTKFSVIGFDVNVERITKLRTGQDDTGELDAEALRAAKIDFTDDAARLKEAGFIIVCVPTPVDAAKRPDFRPLIGASQTIAPNLSPGTVIVYESTVYPGATEEVCIPVVEAGSGLVAGRDFTFGYSPERINPGDRTHTIDRVTKVVSGSDAETLDVVAGVYGAVITAGVHRAASVKVAEAAKVIENTQRDLNIALVNELAMIFHRIGIDTLDVLDAAGTKWNFLPFRPGLVGGHCIGVDPYYLTYKAESLGHNPQVILAGRRINDGIGKFVAQECVRLLADRGGAIKGARVLVMGFTFKEDVPDVRNTRVIDIVKELQRFGCDPVVCDPVADAEDAQHEYGVHLVSSEPMPTAEAIIAAVSHKVFKAMTPTILAKLCPAGAPFLDVKSAYDRTALASAGFTVWRL